MAYSVVETKVVNPAKGHRMAHAKKRRNLSAKQIRAGFGGKRRLASLKAKHRPRTKPNAAKKHYKPHKANPAKKRYVKPATKKHNRAKGKKRNPEIISFLLGNPAQKKGRKMATTKHYNKHNKAGHKSSKKKRYNPRRHNPAGLGRPVDWVKGGLGVLAGVVVTRALPQTVAQAYNNGAVGYAMNAATAIAAAWGAHLTLKDPIITSAVAAGGFAALIARMISDMTTFGTYLSLTGMGDYQFSNWVTPQRLTAWQNAQFSQPWAQAAPALTTSLYGSSTDMGSRGGQC